METFSALLALCAGNSPVTGEFPSQRPVTQSLNVLFDLCPNKRLSKQSWGWWFETTSRLLWRHCNFSFCGGGGSDGVTWTVSGRTTPGDEHTLVSRHCVVVVRLLKKRLIHAQPTMHYFVTEMCTCVHISITKWCIVGYLSNALWDL